MILKGSQRGSGADLAIHLMNKFDNESVEIAEVYGAVAGDLLGAFEEFEAVAAGTKAEKYLYSLSINPSAPLTREQYHEAIQDIETRLGLTGQPRAVVFHVKPDKHGVSREHCHVVWSRIDIDNMKAIQLSHDRRKLMDLACELAQKYGLHLPPGLQAWDEKRRHEKDKLEPSLAEKAQQDEHGITPDQRREQITACYESADNAKAFINALEQKGYVLAKGDRRGFVIIDQFANVHSLTRYVKGHKAKDIKAKLAPLTPDDLPTVDQAKEIVRQRKQAQRESQGEGDRRQEQTEERHRKTAEALAALHAQRRADVQAKEQELFVRQAAERLSLHVAQKEESAGLVFRLRSAVADLIGKTPGLRSVLGHIQKLTHLDPNVRHQLEREALARRHAREKLDIARLKRANVRVEIREMRSLERTLKKAARHAQTADHTVRQDFRDAARDDGLWRKKEFKAGDLQQDFNDAAEFAEGIDRAGDSDDDHAPDWKERAESRSRGQRPRRGRRPRRGKGYGYRQDED